jgi:hypothetical protein
MNGSPAYQRFVDSTVIDYEKWHDGIGFDLSALDEMGPLEHERVLDLVLGRTIEWREIEVLEKLASPRAWKAIEETFGSGGDIDTRLAAAVALERGGKLGIPLDQVVAAAILAIRRIEEGLTRALLLAEQYPTERIKRALLQASGMKTEVALHCGALLCYLCGKATEAFDWNLRPLFLRLAPGNDEADRNAAHRELCALVEMTP